MCVSEIFHLTQGPQGERAEGNLTIRGVEWNTQPPGRVRRAHACGPNTAAAGRRRGAGDYGWSQYSPRGCLRRIAAYTKCASARFGTAPGFDRPSTIAQKGGAVAQKGGTIARKVVRPPQKVVRSPQKVVRSPKKCGTVARKDGTIAKKGGTIAPKGGTIAQKGGMIAQKGGTIAQAVV